jgi:hypothetical protein
MVNVLGIVCVFGGKEKNYAIEIAFNHHPRAGCLDGIQDIDSGLDRVADKSTLTPRRGGMKQE